MDAIIDNGATDDDRLCMVCARDAEIRRECAERADNYCRDYITALQDVTKNLRAAITGEEE